MNPNFDFRSDETWDDSPINDSIGEAVKRCQPKGLNFAAAIVGAVLAVLVIA